jgi:hypothetical protein
MQKEGTGGSEDAVGFDHARAEEADVVVEDVGVGGVLAGASSFSVR